MFEYMYRNDLSFWRAFLQVRVCAGSNRRFLFDLVKEKDGWRTEGVRVEC